MVRFCHRLRSLRKEKGLSQQALSERIGVSKSSVNMYERGEREPNYETLETIADFFDVDIDYLLGKSDTKRKMDFFSIIPATEEPPESPDVFEALRKAGIQCEPSGSVSPQDFDDAKFMLSYPGKASHELIYSDLQYIVETSYQKAEKKKIAYFNNLLLLELFDPDVPTDE